MAINPNDLLRERYSSAAPPRLLCPTCWLPTLQVVTDKDGQAVNCPPNRATARYAQSEDEAKLMRLRGPYTAQLRCTNSSCHETVMVLGEWYMYPELFPDGAIGPEPRYEPRYFYPRVPIFQPPKNVPANILTELTAAFALYWADPAACINRLRGVLELFLSDFGIAAQRMNGGHRSLDERINELASQSANYHGHMHALRWLGNEGSHPAGSITKAEAVDAFMLIEYLLNERFNTHDADMASIAAKINARNPKFQPRPT